MVLLKRKNSEKFFAGKYISKDSIKKKSHGIDWIRNEIIINKKLANCENSSKLIEVQETLNNIILIFELIQGPTLLSDKNQDYKKIGVIKEIMFSLLKGLKQLENKGLVHRDIKPENLIFAKKNDYTSLKIIDYGLACRTGDTDKLTQRICGTPGFIAPEFFRTYKSDFKNILNSKIDVFAAGVIFYKFLFGKYLFKGNRIEENKKGAVTVRTVNKMKTDIVCPLAYDLLLKMVDPDEEKRVGIQEALHHAFFDGIEKKNSFSGETASSMEISIQEQGEEKFQDEEFDLKGMDENVGDVQAVGRILKFQNKFGSK